MKKVINFIAMRAVETATAMRCQYISDEEDQVPSSQEKFTLYCILFCTKYILHHPFISSGLKKQIKLHWNLKTGIEQEKTKEAKNRRNKTNPTSLLWNSDRHQLIYVLELHNNPHKKVMADSSIDQVIQQVIQAPRPLSFPKRLNCSGKIWFP